MGIWHIQEGAPHLQRDASDQTGCSAKVGEKEVVLQLSQMKLTCFNGLSHLATLSNNVLIG